MSKIKILERNTLSNEKYKLEAISCEFASGSGKTIRKKVEVYERPAAATILLYDPVNKKVLLTEQVRIPAFITGGEEKLVEACAGLIENEEDPAGTIIREVLEETGYKLAAVEKIMALYSSPGGNSELIYYYLGEYSPKMKTGTGGGKKDEGEDILPVEWSFDEARNRLKQGLIKDAKTVILLQHAVLNGIFG